MKKVFGTVVVAILILAMYTSCTPESLTNEDETEILVVDPINDESVDGESGLSDPDEEPDPDNRD